MCHLLPLAIPKYDAIFHKVNPKTLIARLIFYKADMINKFGLPGVAYSQMPDLKLRDIHNFVQRLKYPDVA